MQSKLTDLIRVGKVSSVNAQNCTATVTFPDRADYVSGDLFIIVPFTFRDKLYYMPSVGERVLTLFNPDAPSVGFILGSFYSDARLPPAGDENEYYINFEDGTLIRYDKKLHELTVSAVGDVKIISESNITLKGRDSELVL